MNTATLGMFGLPGGTEWIVIGILALLIFGRRLPDVARSVGKSIVEFKRGLKDVKNEIDVQSQIDSTPEPKLESKPEVTSDSARAPEPKLDSKPESTSDSAPAAKPSKESSPASN